MKRRIAIVGGGISGLAAAWFLHRDHTSTVEFTLFEASHRFGGIIETVHTHGFAIECGPDSWVTEKPWAEQLARALGLGDDILRSNDQERRTYIARQGTLTPLPDAMRLMVPTDLDAVRSSPLFTEAAKHAYAEEPSRASELRETSLLRRGPDADESVAAFVRRHFGEDVTETVARPLLAGVLGGDIDRLSARALLSPLVALEAQYGSLILALQQSSHKAPASVFTTLSDGLGALVDRLVQSLPSVSLRLHAPVLRLDAQRGGWTVETTNGSEQFDRVLIATPLDTTRRLLAAIPSAEAQRAAGLPPVNATSGLIVALGYQAQPRLAASIPRGFGFLVADAPSNRHALLACTFLNQKYPSRAPEGATLLRAFFSSSTADELSHLPDRQIAQIARDQLARFLGPLPARSDVAVVRRWPRSLPQYEVGHVGRIAEFESCIAALHGLAVTGNMLRGVGLSDLIRDAQIAAQSLAE